MPIVGLTTNGAAFPRIGELRKGGEKTDPKRPGPDLTYFRFTSQNDAVVKKFAAVYPGQPQSVNVFFPYATTDENFEAWQEEWGAGSLKHRCDGEHVVMVQRNGEYVQPAPGAMKCPGNCKQVGRLKVIIPELGRLAYVVALTTSIWDITEVHSNLAAYEALRGDLRGIPFILSRVPRMISTPTKDGRVRREKWLWHIEAAPEWVQAQLSVMQRQALPNATAPLAIPERVDQATGEIVEPESDIDDVDYDDVTTEQDSGTQTLNDYENRVYTGKPAVFFKAAADWIGCTEDEAKECLRKLGYTALDKQPMERVKQLRRLHNAMLLPDQRPLFDDDTAVSDGAYSAA